MILKSNPSRKLGLIDTEDSGYQLPVRMKSYQHMSQPREIVVYNGHKIINCYQVVGFSSN